MVSTQWESFKRDGTLAYRKYSTACVADEEVARKAGAGIWRGQFVPPWEWRRGKRLATTSATAPDDCRIKSNISRRGERIYCLPGRQNYDRT